ncbi:uncharacterized protein LOC117173648 [Belonocnema kinseyi]|uniref:uncharacterized protein LOC117173648 n=1 Tax=Belonocnema kinseyi TaxID=2817044 RepID=UPI00143DFE5C|nr:uncharacterized protein LOC117173648 [Belonocnema kinseyi]
MARDEEVLSEVLRSERGISFLENISLFQFVILFFHLTALFSIGKNIIRIPKNGTNYYLLSLTLGVIVLNTAIIERFLHQDLDYDWNLGETPIGCKLFYVLKKIDVISLLTVLAILIHWILKMTLSLKAKGNLEIYLSFFMLSAIWSSSIMNLIPEISILNVKYGNNMLACEYEYLKPVSHFNTYELMTFAFPIFEILGLVYCYIFVVIVKTHADIKKSKSYSPDAQLLKWREKTFVILVVMTATFFCSLLIKSMDCLYGMRMENYHEQSNSRLKNFLYWLPVELLWPILVIVSAIINPVLWIMTSQRSNKLSHHESTNEYAPVPIYTIDVQKF